MDLNDVLSDKKPEPVVETTTDDEKPSIQAEIPVFTEKTGKKAFREKEKAAKEAGMAAETKPEPVKEPEKKEEIKAEVKPEVKPEPKQEMTDKERAFLARAIDETNKRQALEARIKELEGKVTPEQPKQFWDDPEAKLNEFEQRIQGVAVNTRLNTAEMIARSKHTDFEEKAAVFAQICQSTPGVWEKALQSPDPAEFAYTIGKNYMDLQQAGNLDNLKAKIEKEVRVRLEAEMKEKADKDAKDRADLPETLSDAHSVQHKRATWSGPTPLDSILGR